ncbi:MAG: acyl-CoA dehydrogenase family protein, partial [Mycobacteriaceae bacterium]|nr:acyl-CoA dehydrogenase family protein [Mycobacteriaceae bacterium]
MTEYLSTANLPDEYQQLAKTVRDFAREVVAPVAAEHDAEHSFPYEIVAGMAEMGLFGLPFPEEYGGMGGDYFALCLALEELGKIDQSVAITLEGGVSLGAMPVYRFGTEEQKQQWLPSLPVTAVTVTRRVMSVPELVMNCLEPLITQCP